MNELEKIKAFFAEDIFASATVGIEIEAASENYAMCRLDPVKKHENAAGTVMGAAIYAMADFCFAVAANYMAVINDEPSVVQTLSSQISYLAAAKPGVGLTAEAKCIKKGRTTCYFNVSIYETENPGRIVAAAAVNGITLSGINHKRS